MVMENSQDQIAWYTIKESMIKQTKNPHNSRVRGGEGLINYEAYIMGTTV